jgi:hypothetical protein
MSLAGTALRDQMGIEGITDNLGIINSTDKCQHCLRNKLLKQCNRIIFQTEF